MNLYKWWSKNSWFVLMFIFIISLISGQTHEMVAAGLIVIMMDVNKHNRSHAPR